VTVTKLLAAYGVRSGSCDEMNMLVGNTCVKEACFKASLTRHEEHKVFVMLAGTLAPEQLERSLQRSSWLVNDDGAA